VAKVVKVDKAVGVTNVREKVVKKERGHRRREETTR
jgi:hypothetical protein